MQVPAEDLPKVCMSSDATLLQTDTFIAGNISSKLNNWQLLTTDKHILSIVKYGLTLQFADGPPALQSPYTYKFSDTDKSLIDDVIVSLEKKGVIKTTSIESDDYFSTIFPRINKDGSTRLLLNL